MTSTSLQKRSVPTIYFVGVTTTQSSIMQVFPKWSEILGLGAEIAGYDAPLHAPVEVYRAIVQHIKDDPLSMGALVTTHKIDLLAATRDLFDYLDPHAELCGEISCISKQNGKLCGHAKDPISSGLAWEAFVKPDHWQQTRGQVLCLGAGGAAVAISIYAANLATPPAKFIAVDIAQERLHELQAIHQKIATPMMFEYRLSPSASQNDALMAQLPPGSLVINATGLGKDRHGSPITDNGIFPQNGLVWELNYRGALDFLHQAKKQAASQNLTLEDGWVYFLHGWTQVIAEVFHIELTPELFKKLDEAASSLRPQ